MKKAIAFGLIIGAIISVCNLCFAAEGEEALEYSTVENLRANLDTSTFVNSNGNNIRYYSVEPGTTYRIFNTAGSTRHFYYSSQVPSANVSFFGAFDLVGGGTDGRNDYITVPNDANYLFVSTNFTTVNTWLYKVDGGLSTFVDNLSYDISMSNLDSVFTVVVPIIAISVLFGLGWYLIRKILNKTKRAKGGGF